MKSLIYDALSAKKYIENILDKCSIENYKNETRILLKHCANLTDTDILRNEQIPKNLVYVLENAVRERAGGTPLQYILGEWDFYGNTFFVGEGVLIPRPETELLVDEVIKFYDKNGSYKMLDLCTGSGCIAITLAKIFKQSSVTAVDYYDIALNYCKKNIAHNKVENVFTIKTNVLKTIEKSEIYDIIVSNPPYINTAEMKNLSAEVRCEPQTALHGGTDGLDFYKAIVQNYTQVLAKNGRMVLEIGYKQAEAVSKLFLEHNYLDVNIKEDYNGLDRIVVAKKE